MTHNSRLEGSKFFITLAAMLAALMAVLDISIVNVAINDIRASFGVQIDQIAWISTGYMMANVIVIPLTGWFQKRFGLRNYFVFSVFVFTCASLLCGLSWDLTSMTCFRILQGMGGGAIIPTASTILMTRYPSDQQGMAQAFVGLGAITGPLLGPSLGGYLIQVSSWHMIFLINIPFGILAILLAYRNIKEINFVPHAPNFDYKGVLLIIVGLGSLQYVLEEGNRHQWFEDNTILLLSILSFTCLTTLIVHQLETENPMIDFRVFKNRNYILCSMINFLLGTALFGASFLYSLFCGEVLKYAPLDIGLLFLQGCCIQVIMMPLVGKFITKIDGRLLAFLGIILVASSIFLNSKLNQNASSGDLILVLFIRSMGLACVFIPLSVIAVDQIHRKDLGNAVGLFNLTRELGGSIGLAIMSSQLLNHLQIHSNHMRKYVSSGNLILQYQTQIIQGLFTGRLDDVHRATNIFLQNRITLQAIVASFGLCFFVLSSVFFMSVILLFFMKKQNPNSRLPIELIE